MYPLQTNAILFQYRGEKAVVNGYKVTYHVDLFFIMKQGIAQSEFTVEFNDNRVEFNRKIVNFTQYGTPGRQISVNKYLLFLINFIKDFLQLPNDMTLHRITESSVNKKYSVLTFCIYFDICSYNEFTPKYGKE